MNLERSCALIKGQEIKMRYNIVFLISYPFSFVGVGGGGGWLVFPCTIDPILSTMSCLVQLSLFWQLTRFYYFFFCSLLGLATTSISQHQQNWPRRIISFILGGWVIPILVIYNVFVSVCVCVCVCVSYTTSINTCFRIWSWAST